MCRCPARTRSAFLAPAAVAVALAVSLCARAEQPQQLDALLDRLGLVELRLHRLERALAAETDSARRIAAARRLADSFAEQLVAAADGPDRFGRLHARVEKLLADIPEARTPAVEVVLWQAEYQQAEAKVIQWLEDPADKRPLADAAATLGRIAPLLTGRRGELAAVAEKAAESIESLPTAAERSAAELLVQKQQALALRAGYFAGWSHYYLGVTRQDPPAARRNCTAAKEQFLIVLDLIDDKNYESVEADGLGLESMWRARAVIGLGLAELGLGRQAAAASVFRWLDQPAAPTVLRDQSAYWQVQGMLNAGLAADAARFVASEIAAADGKATAGKTSLALAAIRGGLALGQREAAARAQLVAEGLRGLARMRQFATLDKLIEKHRLDAGTTPASFTLAWLRGRRQYLGAEKSQRPDDFRAAEATLTAALSQPEAKANLADAGQARYYLAWCRFRLGELPAAARTFQEAATALRASAGDLAVQAAWMQATCLVTLAAKDKQQFTPAIAALQSFQQEYPASEHAGRAELLIVRLRQSYGSPAEAIRELAAIQPASANYIQAQYEICQLQHQLWSQAKNEPQKAALLAAEVVRTADRFLAGSHHGGDPAHRLKASLLAIDVLHAADPPDLGRIAALVSGVAEAAGGLDPKGPTAIEYQYRRLQLAQRTNDAVSARAASESIAKYGGGSQYELPALVIVAKAVDAAVAAAAESEQAAKKEEAAAIYARLVALLGDSPAELAKDRNALAASSKLAQYEEELRRWDQAAARLHRLVEALPKDRRLLRRAGIASFQAGQHGASLDHWRTMLAGTESGSDEWLEAKYYQLACLLQTDRPAAKKVYDQFKLLYPEVKSPAWREKFEEYRAL